MQELASITESKCFAMLLRTYIDDSADETQEKAVVAGAYIGFYHQWNKLQRQWKSRLKRDGLKYFRASEYYSLRGEFSRFTDPVKYPKPKGSQAATALLSDLETTIHKVGIMGLAVCVDMAAYRDIRATEPHASSVFPADAFEMALQWIVKGCAELVRDEFKEHGMRKVAFICDDSSSSSKIASIYSEFKKLNPDISEYMAGLTHQDDKRFPQLQTADLMAHLARRRFIDWLNDPAQRIFTDDSSLRERLQRLSVHWIAVWTRKHIMETLAREIKNRGLSASV